MNILTNHAVNNGRIKVFGGGQLRPNIHIEDMAELYLLCLQHPDRRIDGKVFNAGYGNRTVMEIAETVRGVVDKNVDLEIVPTDDLRSYQVCSDRIHEELGFRPTHSIETAVRDIVSAFRSGRLPNPMTDARYYNIRTMQEIKLS